MNKSSHVECLQFKVLALLGSSNTDCQPFRPLSRKGGGDTFGQYAKSSSKTNIREGVTKSVLQGLHDIVQSLLVLSWLDFWLGWVQRNIWPWRCTNWQLDQGLSKHQEVSSTPVTKVKKMIVGFWDLLGATKR